MFKAYIKDKLDLTAPPKAFVDVNSFTIRRDLLTSANSTFEILNISSNINEGDVFVLYREDGKIFYYGIISKIDSEQIECSQIQSFYKGLWICDTHASATLEEEIAYLLGQYANGYLKGSNWQDLLVQQEKAPITINYVASTTTNLEVEEGTKDFEEFIYELYSKYGIVFDFTMPYGNAGSVEIRKPSAVKIKIGNNAECISNLTPTTEIEQTNKLVVFDKNKVYRTTFVYTTTNGIVEEPSTIAGRLSVVNTKVVKSDDALEVIKQANISDNMFNHLVSFDLLLNNKLYDFWSWELGQTIEIYDDGKYFDSVFTGYEMSVGENQEPTFVNVICGKVRTKLTSLLKLGIAK